MYSDVNDVDWVFIGIILTNSVYYCKYCDEWKLQLIQEIMFSLLALSRVERIANPFSEQVVTEYSDEDCKTGEGRKPPGDLDVVLA
jgi:hypothetical protein